MVAYMLPVSHRCMPLKEADINVKYLNRRQAKLSMIWRLVQNYMQAVIFRGEYLTLF